MTIIINILSIIAGIFIFLMFHDVDVDVDVDVGVENSDMSAVVFAIIAMIAVQVFFIPVRIADNQDHPNILPITVLTIAGGWTGILWIGALIWSLYTPQVEIKVNTTIIESNEKGDS